jgi:hypothetical protein
VISSRWQVLDGFKLCQTFLDYLCHIVSNILIFSEHFEKFEPKFWPYPTKSDKYFKVFQTFLDLLVYIVPFIKNFIIFKVLKNNS